MPTFRHWKHRVPGQTPVVDGSTRLEAVNVFDGLRAAQATGHCPCYKTMAVSSRWPRSALILAKQTRESFGRLNVRKCDVIKGCLTVHASDLPPKASRARAKRRDRIVHGRPKPVASSDVLYSKFRGGFSTHVVTNRINQRRCLSRGLECSDRVASISTAVKSAEAVQSKGPSLIIRGVA